MVFLKFILCIERKSVTLMMNTFKENNCEISSNHHLFEKHLHISRINQQMKKKILNISITFYTQSQLKCAKTKIHCHKHFFNGRKLHFKQFWGFNLTLWSALLRNKGFTIHWSHFLYKTEGFPGLIRRKSYVTNKGECIPVLKNNIESQIKTVK